MRTNKAIINYTYMVQKDQLANAIAAINLVDVLETAVVALSTKERPDVLQDDKVYLALEIKELEKSEETVLNKYGLIYVSSNE